MTYRKLLDKEGNPILAGDERFIWVYGDSEENAESLWRTTVTIYNKKIDTEKKIVKWYMTVLRNCFWGFEIDAGIRGGGFQAYSAEDRTQHERPAVVVRIPYQKNYQSPESWNKYPNGFTVKPDDIIIKGSTFETFSEKDGRSVNSILNQYGNNAIVVKKVVDNVDGRLFIRHIRAEGY